MKKSERRKIKLKAILVEKYNISDAKECIKTSFPNRKRYNFIRFLLHRNISTIHELLFKLRAMEKQMPMPVKVVVEGYMPFLRVASCYCQNCGEKITSDVHSYNNDILSIKHIKEYNQKHIRYCKRCGQKLWW